MGVPQRVQKVLFLVGMKKRPRSKNEAFENFGR